jgi:hypothetical protein
MKKLVRAVFALMLVLSAQTPARAGFIDNYRAWQQLGPDGQAAYAMAIFDVMIVFVAGDDNITARALGLRQCGEALQLKASMMAQAITKYYRDYPQNQLASPFVAFNGYLERGACSPFINAVRAQMGLKPIKKLDSPG